MHSSCCIHSDSSAEHGAAKAVCSPTAGGSAGSQQHKMHLDSPVLAAWLQSSIIYCQYRTLNFWHAPQRINIEKQHSRSKGKWLSALSNHLPWQNKIRRAESCNWGLIKLIDVTQPCLFCFFSQDWPLRAEHPHPMGHLSLGPTTGSSQRSTERECGQTRGPHFCRIAFVR